MKLEKKLFLVFFLLAGAFSSCKKEDYDPEKQLAVDDARIKEFITKNNIPAIKDNKSGLYYEIITPGSGGITPTNNSQVTVKYEGRLLNGSIFDKNTTGATFLLGNLITGWQYGIPLVKKGGKIRLIVPSTLAYMDQARVGIPANSVLDFTIELINAQ